MLTDFGTRTDGQRLLGFHCPACGYGHAFEVPRWRWNGDMIRPTFEPSLLIHGTNASGARTVVCHLFVRDGMIRFCNDNPHAFNGRVVPLTPEPQP